MKRSTEINQTYANSIHVILNLFQHLNQPSPGAIPTQVRDGACFGAIVKAQMSKLTLASGRPPEVEIPTQVRDDSRFSTNVKAHSKVN